MPFRIDIPAYLSQISFAATWSAKWVRFLESNGYEEVSPGVWENKQTGAVVQS